eukprot:CAMPEP_0175901724 /NCGR_PEP_ID=MMETSP0108-20121206/3015_1 /TAXON_ID=195067 ORGANISM="Goniomonas pacifica, Strain CCMP1869" /NCGR_SAMPLE_ID=MMETSP0108 /ASSEMBLY_ACC=CAM_ASM_000204 /LENGTH=271 /DNA_ID=CAMNT_0017223327 /DNA_START=14 /DNA_END=829 /DNA_ORIENTATION=+
MWPGQAMSIEIEEELFHEKSKFQDVRLFKSKTYGNVLLLDGVIQVTERDEFSYQEMIAHIPMFAHPSPKKVLVVGGGDGGALREVCRHKDVVSVDHCEIDEMVIEVSKRFLPALSVGFSDPRVTMHIGDGLAFLREKKEEYDVIITDSSDPVGPADSLFGPDFYTAVFQALKPDGVACSQGENLWLHLDMIAEMKQMCSGIFPLVEYAYVTIPTYPSGQIGFMLCSKNGTSLKNPAREPDATFAAALRYYEPAVHRASFVLPKFARLRLEA